MGVLMFEMLVGRTPFEAQEEDDLDGLDGEDFEARKKRRRNEIMANILTMKMKLPNDAFTATAEKTVKRILKRHPSERLGSAAMGGTDALKRAPWFRDMRTTDWDAILNGSVTPPPLRDTRPLQSSRKDKLR